ncbi:MAG: putative bifunctional diguanylate cyclase/phosphodiesterase [Acidimicrobiia bacterium]
MAREYQPLRRPTIRQGRVWALIAVMAAAAIALAPAASSFGLLDTPFRIHWMVMVPLVFAGEVAVVSLQFRKDAHVFAMGEVPLVMGLYFVEPLGLIAAQVVGNALALVLYRRQSPLKATFNLAMLTLQTGIGIVVFRSILRTKDPLGMAGWTGALAAVAAGVVLASLLVNAAIFLSSGDLSRSERINALKLLAVSSTMNAALGLVAVTVMWTRPGTAWAAAVPPVALYLAYRAYVAQRDEKQRIQGLYDATRALHQSPQVEAAMLAAARHARSMFDAERAEMRVFLTGPNGDGLLAAVGLSDHTEVIHRSDREGGSEVWREVLSSGRSRLLSCQSDQHGRRSNSRHQMMVPVHGHGKVNGVLVVTEPMGDLRNFTTQDLRMFETLASQVTVSLENGRLEDSLAQVTKLKDDLRDLTLHDVLTGLANRALLWERLTEAVKTAKTRDRQSAVLVLDLDDFKTINDTLGHAAGDQLLIGVARRLEACCRPEDTVARLGGDEFAILLDRLSAPGDATAVAARIAESLREPLVVAGQDVTTQASLGIALVEDNLGPEELIHRADQAMYSAKTRRKGSYQVFEEGIQVRWTEAAMLRSDLAMAIERDELVLHYQPIVNMETGDITGVEALIRWDHPERGLLSPDTFISAAEETGQIVALGRWVLHEACRQMRRWHNQSTGSKPTISVNLSPRELEEPDIVDEVRRALTESGLDPQYLVVEITENVLLQPYTQILDRLKELGIRIALDDFGTGYSSLAYLHRLPIDIVKIDRTFVHGAALQQQSPLARLIVQIGDILGLKTVAEGIETPEEFQWLRELGCDAGQGYLFARPMDAQTIAPLLATNMLERASIPAKTDRRA